MMTLTRITTAPTVSFEIVQEERRTDAADNSVKFLASIQKC